MITKGVKIIIILFVIIVLGVMGVWLLVQKISGDNKSDQAGQDQSDPFTKQIPDPRTLVS